MRLKLTRPLVFFDIESTGVNPYRDRIVELAVVKLFPDGRREETVRRFNPGMPIPPGATAIHGISDADVADKPGFETVAGNLIHYLSDSDLAGYNIIKFDIPMLMEEFKRARVTFALDQHRIVDVFHIFCKLYPRNLAAAYQFFCGKNLDDAHSAGADTAATLEVLMGQLDKHPELSGDLGELADFSGSRDVDLVDAEGRFKFSGEVAMINFGKNSGRTLREVAENDPGFLRWIIRSDFSEEVKSIAQNALVGRYPTRKTPTPGAQS